MGIITKIVRVYPRGTAIAHYRKKGYDAKFGQELEVKVEDLPLCSTVLVDTICDYCGEPKEPQKYVAYNAQTKNGTEKCCCSKCMPLKRGEVMIKRYGHEYAFQVPELKKKIQETNMERYGSVSPAGNMEVREKQKETNMERYGVEYPSQSKEVQDKIKQTNLERYGVEYVSQSEEVKEKVKQTVFDRYGAENISQNTDIQNKKIQSFIKHLGVPNPLQNKECLEKIKQTNIERYGVEFPSQSEEIKQKVKQTNIERYGYENPMQSPEILEKWFLKNSFNFIKYSKQQQYICNLYNGMLNYPFKCYALDIFLPEENLDIEFDGSGHKMSVSLGSVSEEEFNKKELYRNIALKKEGYKQMRIISTKDLLPSDQILLQMLNQTRNYFSQYPNHSWIEYNIDTSTVRNAEHKDGIPYDFGELRTIKDSDISTIKSVTETEIV